MTESARMAGECAHGRRVRAWPESARMAGECAQVGMEVKGSGEDREWAAVQGQWEVGRG
jgi:hypothetical protein